jgi:hypothetical protein
MCAGTGLVVAASRCSSPIEALNEDVRIPAALSRRLERVLRVEIAERERHRAEATEFLDRRLRRLANKREKLLRAYYAEAIDVPTLKREQSRINSEVAETELQLATEGDKLKRVKDLIDLALDLANICAASYRKARPEVRKMWNQAFFRTIRVQDGRIADSTYEEPFASLLGSHKGSIVEVGGFEPPCSGDRPGLLRAQPGGEISLRGSHRRRTSRPARVRCPVAAPRQSRLREPANDVLSPSAGTPERTAT